MSASFIASLKDLTIASGATTSRSVITSEETSDAIAVCLMAPGALDAGTYTIEVSADNTTFVTLSDGTADIGPPSTSKGRQYTEVIGFPYWRIKGPAAAADRVFKCWKLYSN